MNPEFESIRENLSPEVSRVINIWSNVSERSKTPIYIKGGAIRDTLAMAIHGNIIKINDLDLVIPNNLFNTVRIAMGMGGKIIERGKRKKLPKYKITFPNISIESEISLLQANAYSFDDDRNDDAMLLENAELSNFDVNTLVFDIHNGKLHDKLNGIRSIREKTIKLVSTKSIVSDPSTIFDGIRIAAKLKFSLSPGTREAIRDNSFLILNVKDWFLVQKIKSIAPYLNKFQIIHEFQDLGFIDLRPNIVEIVNSLYE